VHTRYVQQAQDAGYGNDVARYVDDQARALEEARAMLRTGAVAPGEEPRGDPVDEAFGAYQFEKDAGGSVEHAQAAYVERVFAAASAGDTRVTLPHAADERRADWVEQGRQRSARRRASTRDQMKALKAQRR
jgi:hypothetical protein